MGLFDNIMKKAEQAGEAVRKASENAKQTADNIKQEAAKNAAGNSAKSTDHGAAKQAPTKSTPLDPTKQVHVRFGTIDPVPYIDMKTGLQLGLVGAGSAIIAVKDVNAYKDEEDMIEKAREICNDEIKNQIKLFSGNISYDNTSRLREEFSIACKMRLFDAGITGVANFDMLNLSEESKKMVDKIKKENMLAENPALAEAERVLKQAEAAKNSGSHEPIRADIGIGYENGGNTRNADTLVGGINAEGGQGVGKVKFCPNCGSPVGAGKFCGNCGCRLQ
ncbi:MAG: hypothetical protein IJ661_09525 [Lachnospiraceae bacterium]|nr:hypothetical protein [Lachnospiraceae bacterium]